MKHDVAKQAANEVALKEVDKEFFDLRLSLALVTISDEEGEIDILARPDILPGNFCAERIFVKATEQPFSKNWRLSGRKEDYTLSMLKNVRSQDRAHHSEKQDT